MQENATVNMIDMLLSLAKETNCPIVGLTSYKSKLIRARSFALCEGRPYVLSHRQTLEVLSSLLIDEMMTLDPSASEEFLKKCTELVLELLGIDYQELRNKAKVNGEEVSVLLPV